MLIVNGDRPCAVPLDLAPGVATPLFFWAAVLLHLPLRRLVVVLSPDAFFDASEFYISIGAVLSDLAFFPYSLVYTGEITVEMSAVRVLLELEVLSPPPLLVRGVGGPTWDRSGASYLGVGVCGGF